MRFARGDVRTISFHPKSIADLRSGAKRDAAAEEPKDQLSRDFWVVRFRLLQQYLPRGDIECLHLK